MSGIRSRKNLQSPSRRKPISCIFCGLKAKLTFEHLLGPFKNIILPQTSTTSHTVSQRNMLDPNELTQVEFGILNRTGGYHSQKLKLVCKRCNNTWMSNIQNNAKIAAESLVRGAAVELNHSSHSALACFAVLTTMTMEFAHVETMAVLPAERTRFFNEKSPSSKWAVFYGTCNPALNCGYWHRNGVINPNILPELDLDDRSVQTTTMQLGGLIIHTLYCHSSLFPDFAIYVKNTKLSIIFPKIGGLLKSFENHQTMDRNDFNHAASHFWTTLGFSPLVHFGLIDIDPLLHQPVVERS